MLDESGDELGVALLVLGVLGAFDLKPQIGVLLLHGLSVERNVAQLCRDFKVLGGQVLGLKL